MLIRPLLVALALLISSEAQAQVNCGNQPADVPPDIQQPLGTTSSDFVNTTLVQIQNASRMPSGGISETSVNAVLAIIEAAEPRNEMEAALAIQMACTHAVAMAVLSRAGGAYGGDRHVAIMALAGARLLNAFTAQVEAMRRLRNGGTQVIRIERVEVRDGSQAVIGNVKQGGSREK
jgi:hypothetical protein